VDRDFVYANDIDVLIPDSLVAAGPYGTIGDYTLDAANFSTHGFAIADTLPAGSVSLFSSGPAANNRVAAFAYALGRGFVYYAAIPLDYFFDISGDNSFKTIYAPNLLLYINRLKPDEDWYRLTVDPWSHVLLETRTPADGEGEFVNPLNPMIRVYDTAGTCWVLPTRMLPMAAMQRFRLQQKIRLSMCMFRLPPPSLPLRPGDPMFYRRKYILTLKSFVSTPSPTAPQAAKTRTSIYWLLST
jgi:hypothetical protein